MDPDTAEIFNTTTIGELNAATQEWLESLSMSAQSQGFVPSLIEDAVRNETNAERMGRGDRITADDIGGRSGWNYWRTPALYLKLQKTLFVKN